MDARIRRLWGAVALATCALLLSAAQASADPDLTPPNTTIQTGPTGSVNTATATFDFAADEPATYECKLDADVFAACATPTSYVALTDGPHVFWVRATDMAGNVNDVDASATFTVDTVAPQVSIDATPYELTNETVADFAFSATEPATFECALDEATFAACTSPTEYSGLGIGEHTFQVRATDAAGNLDQVDASYTFTIVATRPAEPTYAPDTTDPVVVITKQRPKKGKRTAVVEFSAADDRTVASSLSFTCILDRGAGKACGSPATYRHLKTGRHSVTVLATDSAGNLSAPATTSFRIKKR